MVKKSKNNFNFIIISITVIIIVGIFAIVQYSYGNKIYNKKIKSIQIKYYEGYNIATGNAISDTVPLNKINLEEDDLKEVSNLIKRLTKIKSSKSDERAEHLYNDYILDYYMLEINNNFIIYIGEQYGIIDGTKNYFKVPTELYNKVLEITQNHNDDYD